MSRRVVSWAYFAAVAAGAAAFAVHFYPRLSQPHSIAQDIYYSYVEGGRILKGENPYAFVLAGDMVHNQKYATYLPLFYLLSALTQAAGLAAYPSWLGFWVGVFLSCDVAMALVLYWACARRGRLVLGVFAAAFWFLNRWVIHVAVIGHLDFPPLLLLVASLLLFDRRRRLSLVLFGGSLAWKHVAAFLVPVYLIWVWQEDRAGRGRRTAWSAAAIAAAPLLVSLPFIVWNAEGFFKSVWFSMTRLPANEVNVADLAWLTGWTGLAARLPMLALLVLLYVLVCRRQIGRHLAVLLTFAVFLDFNSVLFPQYMCWLVPFVPLSVLDWTAGRPTAASEVTAGTPPGRAGRGGSSRRP
jgi:uncharacterized membrane protein